MTGSCWRHFYSFYQISCCKLSFFFAICSNFMKLSDFFISTLQQHPIMSGKVKIGSLRGMKREDLAKQCEKLKTELQVSKTFYVFKVLTIVCRIYRRFAHWIITRLRRNSIIHKFAEPPCGEGHRWSAQQIEQNLRHAQECCPCSHRYVTDTEAGAPQILLGLFIFLFMS